MKKRKAEICYHPNLVPTKWNQSEPEPCEMLIVCDCGNNQICPVCGYGFGSYPCSCQSIEGEIKVNSEYLPGSPWG